MTNKLFSSLDDIWPIFRIRINEKQYTTHGNVFGRSSTDSYIKSTIISIFKGISNIWKIRYYKTWILSSSMNFSKINDKLYDSVTSEYIDNISNALLIVRPHYKFSTKDIWTQRVMSESLLLIAVFGVMFFLKLGRKSVPFESDLKIKAKDINYKIYYYRFLAEYIVFDKLIKWFKIDRVFVSCSYSYFGYIYACKKNKVKVIEIQHGIINKEHRAYIYKMPQNLDLFPDRICVFGSYFKNIILNNSSLYTEDKIKIIGSNSLHIYNTGYKEYDKHIVQLRSRYKKIILFTGQFTVDMKSLEVIDSLQEDSNDICFLFLARKKEEIIHYKKQFKNVVFYEGTTKFYNLVKHVDIHATVYSTTFLESLRMGIPNILLDIDNYSNKYYKEILNKNYPFILCSTNKKDILHFIENLIQIDQQVISNSVNEYFDNNFNNNLNQLLS